MPHRTFEEEKHTFGFNQQELEDSFKEQELYEWIKTNEDLDPANFNFEFSDLYFYVEQNKKKSKYKLWVVPKIWFEEKRTLWDRFVLLYLKTPIGKFEELAPGYFETYLDEYETLDHAMRHLSYLGMEYNESIMFESTTRQPLEVVGLPKSF